MRKVLFFCSSLLVLAACGDGDSSGSLTDDIENITASIPSSEREPCDYISEATVKEVFGVSESIEIASNDKYGVCSFDWDGLNEAERAAADEEMTSAMMSAMMSGKTLDRATLTKGQFSVSLNFINFKVTTSSEAKTAYERLNKQMSEGIKVTADQVKEKSSSLSDKAIDDVIGDGMTFKGGKRTAINGVGDAATWDDKLKQLTVLSGADIFFLTVEAGGDETLSIAKSKKLAENIIDKL